jgi:hypothetical protein
MDLSYFTTPNPDFGAPEWVFFIAQFAVAIVGAYLSFMHSDANPVRGPALRRLGYAMAILGLLGATVGALRRSAIEPFTAPYWMTLVTVLSVLLVIYAIYYATAVYPGRLAAWEASQRGKGARSAVRVQQVQRSTPREGAPRAKKSSPTAQRHAIRAGDAPPVVSTNGATSDAWLSRIGERRLSHQKESADPVCQGCIDPIRSAGIARQRYFHELLITWNAGAAGGALCTDDIQHGDARARAPRITERNACHRRRAVADMRHPRQTQRRGARAADQRRCRSNSDANGNPPSLSHQILCQTHRRYATPISHAAFRSCAE